MDKSLKTITERRSMVNNARTVTRKVKKKKYSGINKKITKKKKRLMTLKTYITTTSYLDMMRSRAKIKESTRKLRICSLMTQDLGHIW